MISVYARTPSDEVPQNDRNIENGSFSEIIFDFLTQGNFLIVVAYKIIPYFIQTIWNFHFQSYFLKKPLPMLMALYIFNVFAVGYIVFALERNHGTCMQYKDVVWMMGVTITNLGFGDFTPSSSGKVKHLRSQLIISGE